MRTMNSLLALALVIGLAAPGCSDDTTPVQLDAQVVDTGPGTDGNITDSPLTDLPAKADAGPPALLTVVVNSLTMPKTSAEYAVDLDGDSKPDNKFGDINAALDAAGFNLQTDLDAQVKDGIVILLFEVFAKALTADPAMSMQFHQGYDSDNDPTDNFLGSEVFGLAVTSPSNLVVQGAISSSTMQVGPGDLSIPVPLGATSLLVGLKKASVKADLSSTGMTNGQINGAIPATDIDQKIIPAMATMVDAYYKSTTITPATKLILKSLFDAAGDGTISADDIRNSILKTALAPDIDTDNDSTKDALSIGMGFTAVTCSINKGI